MDVRAAIDLAREPALRLGPITVRPSTRELVADDGAREVLEPRVMQVLVALAKAGGEILTRDDLTACCWEGRVVGEDAINRVISRLRRSAEGIGQGAFRIETITKVGYRLAGEARVSAAAEAPSPVAAKPSGASRRKLILAGGAVALAAAGGVAAWRWPRKAEAPELPLEVRSLYDQGWVALGQSTPEHNAAAVGLFTQVTEHAPDHADAWGALAYAYGQSAVMGPPELREGQFSRARSAADRAKKIDPDNVMAASALIGQQYLTGGWLAAERAYRAVLARNPKAGVILSELCSLLFSVGRVQESVDAGDKAMALLPPSPQFYYRHITGCMSALRLEQADRISAKALELYPRHFGVWFTTFYLYMYTGRAAKALAFGSDIAGRPTGIPAYNFDLIMAAAKAVQTGAKADIDKAVAMNLEAAHQGAGYAENAMLFASFLGRLDVAFQIAEAYFFRRGFDPGARSFSNEQANYYPAPRTHCLFQLGAANMWTDPRFDAVVGELGLKRYWAESGTKPDYQRKPA